MEASIRPIKKLEEAFSPQDAVAAQWATMAMVALMAALILAAIGAAVVELHGQRLGPKQVRALSTAASQR